MSTNKKTHNLLRYINTPMTLDEILLRYNANNISYEKCELFKDFILSLVTNVFDTYMGDDLMTEKDKYNQYVWCWKKTVDDFEKEGIIIGNPKTFAYFKEFMFDIYYNVSNKDENPQVLTNIKKLWTYIFKFNNLKSKADLDTMIEVYRLMDVTLKSKFLA